MAFDALERSDGSRIGEPHRGLRSALFEKGITMSVRLFVGNLAQETTKDEIRELFSSVGGVESCQLMSDWETGRLKGFGFVEMDTPEAASAAKEKFNGHDLHGKSLKVNEAKPKAERYS